MPKVDMSARAVTARLRRVSELRRLCLSLQKAKVHSNEVKRNQKAQSPQPSLKQDGHTGK
jgi:hypothetical protein